MNDDVRGVAQLVSNLVIAEPDRRRSVETRARCVALFAKRAKRNETAFTPVLVGGFCALYLSLIAFFALRWT